MKFLTRNCLLAKHSHENLLASFTLKRSGFFFAGKVFVQASLSRTRWTSFELETDKTPLVFVASALLHCQTPDIPWVFICESLCYLVSVLGWGASGAGGLSPREEPAERGSGSGVAQRATAAGCRTAAAQGRRRRGRRSLVEKVRPRGSPRICDRAADPRIWDGISLTTLRSNAEVLCGTGVRCALNSAGV